MVTGAVIVGSCDERGEMVCGPSPGIAKSIESAPAAKFASWMAALSVHGLARPAFASQTPSRVTSSKSAIESTVKVSAWAGLAAANTPMEAATKRVSNQKPRVLALSTHIVLRIAILVMPLTLPALAS
jgi:hypothetical protein